MNRLALVTGIAALVALAACSAPAATAAPGSTDAGSSVAPMATTIDAGAGSISTAGTGKAKGTPDVMTIGLAVATQSALAKDALDQNNAVTADVIAVLKENGVDEADLQTNQLSVYPTYDNQSTITGYQVTNGVTATIRNLGTAGSVIDAVAAKAGNAARVQQISFSISDDSALKATARAAAVRQAQAQAKQMADAAGVQLGAIRSIAEAQTVSGDKYYAAAADSAAGAAVPLEAGTQELTVDVQIVYDIAP